MTTSARQRGPREATKLVMAVNGDSDGRAAFLEYAVLEGETRSVTLHRGNTWTFGRSNDCSETLSIPALSRVSLAVHQLDIGVLRVVSRQSNMGRVLISSDDDMEQHTIGLGAGPVHLAGGNYTLKVELPPIVLRMQIAVPALVARRPVPEGRSSPKRVAERTALSWGPELGTDDQAEWIAVVALAVTLARYSDVVPAGTEGAAGQPVKMSEALRRAAAVWCGHTSLYWVNERLKEAVAAADLDVPDGGERLAVVIAHYTQFFSSAMLRSLRDDLVRMHAPAGGQVPDGRHDAGGPASSQPTGSRPSG